MRDSFRGRQFCVGLKRAGVAALVLESPDFTWVSNLVVFILEHRQRFEGISFYIGLKPIRGFLTLCANFRDI